MKTLITFRFLTTLVVSCFGLASFAQSANEFTSEPASVSPLIERSEIQFVLDEALTRNMTHLVWQQPPVRKLRLKLLPLINASKRNTFEAQSGFDGRQQRVETAPVPSALPELAQQLLLNTGQVQLVAQQEELVAQFILHKYQPLYFRYHNDNWASRILANAERFFMENFGEEPQAQVRLSLHLMAPQTHQILKTIVVDARLTPCTMATQPATLAGTAQQQAFLNNFASSTIGQTTVAAFNQAIAAASQWLAQDIDFAYVAQVVGNEIYLSVGKPFVKVDSTLELLYQHELPTGGFELRPVGNLKVVQASEETAIAYAMDLPTDSVRPGDKVRLLLPSPRPRYVSAAGRPVACYGDSSDEDDEDDPIEDQVDTPARKNTTE